VAFVDQFNKGMQRIMALKSPEIMKLMPQVEAMTFEARVAMVKRGQGNLAALIKGWDKFAPIMASQGMDRSEIKRRLKGLRSAKNHLDDALRLADPKLPPQFKDQAESAFNVLVAAFIRDAENIHSVLTGPRVSPQSIIEIMLPSFDASVARGAASQGTAAKSAEDAPVDDGSDDLVVDHAADAVMDGSDHVRTGPEAEVRDVITERGGDRVS
jgi:hypothetical protein